MSENKQIEQLLIEIKAYVDKLHEKLKVEIPGEIDKNKEEFEEIITLAGELDAYFKKR